MVWRGWGLAAMLLLILVLADTQHDTFLSILFPTLLLIGVAAGSKSKGNEDEQV